MTKVRSFIAVAALALSCAALAQTTTPPASAPAQTPQTPILEESYKVQPDDQINIAVKDVPDAGGQFTVGKDGVINMQLTGELNVAGLTRKEIADLVASKLKKEIRNPIVTVSVTSTSQRRIYLLGAIRSGGVIDWKPQWRLTELIAAGGGLASEPERTKVLIFRKGVDHMEIPMKRLLVDGDDKANVDVFPNDVVNFQTDVRVRVNVVGKVGHQGMVEVLEGQGVSEVLAAAGGTGADARLTGAKLLRKGKEVPVDLYTAVVKGEPSENVTVQDGDTLVVPTLLNKIAVIGQVGRPGPIVVPDGEILTLTKAVSLAGGPGRGAKLDSVGIVRMGPDRKPVATKYDLKALLRGDPKNKVIDPILQDGDLVVIAQSGKAGYGEFSQGIGVFGFLNRWFPF